MLRRPQRVTQTFVVFGESLVRLPVSRILQERTGQPAQAFVILPIAQEDRTRPVARFRVVGPGRDLLHGVPQLDKIRLDRFESGLELGCFLLFALLLQTLEEIIECVVIGRRFRDSPAQPGLRLCGRSGLHCQAAALGEGRGIVRISRERLTQETASFVRPIQFRQTAGHPSTELRRVAQARAQLLKLPERFFGLVCMHEFPCELKPNIVPIRSQLQEAATGGQ